MAISKMTYITHFENLKPEEPIAHASNLRDQLRTHSKFEGPIL